LPLAAEPPIFRDHAIGRNRPALRALERAMDQQELAVGLFSPDRSADCAAPGNIASPILILYQSIYNVKACKDIGAI
jgi:hypothetical protein